MHTICNGTYHGLSDRMNSNKRKKHSKMYNNIKIVLATKHQKEQAITHPFANAFNANIFVPNDYDTDKFGTFTGEIERSGTQYETVINKAKQALTQYDYDYAVASEGSFGPHPVMFYMPGNVELMSFIDKKRDIIVVESIMTTDTNYRHIDISQHDEYETYLEKIKFGSHGLIIKCLPDNAVLAKGIKDRGELDAIVRSSLTKHQRIRLETDMRAMMNPTRMNIIHMLATKLIQRLQHACPACDCPGFGRLSVTGNLSCEDCGTKTDLHQYKVLHCVKCNHQETQMRDDGAITAEAKYCPYCNP